MTRHRVAVQASAVMGRVALLNTSLWLAAAAAVQLTPFPGVFAVGEVGGPQFDRAWALTLILAAALIVAAQLTSRRADLEGRASVLEVAGAALMVIGLGIYLTALLLTDRGAVSTTDTYPPWLVVLEGRLVLIALIGSGITNTIGRVVLLLRRLRWAPRLRDHA